MIDDTRKNKRTQLSGAVPEKSIQTSAALEHKDILEQAFGQLDDKQKQIIMLRDWQGYSYKEIGEILDYNESLVKVHLFRARKKMRAIINQLNTIQTSYNENQ
jgi:RNA polymerase sigma-70 factor (ECF subfamily)